MARRGLVGMPSAVVRELLEPAARRRGRLGIDEARICEDSDHGCSIDPGGIVVDQETSRLRSRVDELDAADRSHESLGARQRRSIAQPTAPDADPSRHDVYVMALRRSRRRAGHPIG